jgi:hypothetical protein
LYCALVCPVLLQRSGHSVHCLTAIETAMSPDTIDGAGESSCGDSAGNRETCRYLDTVSKLERLTGFEPTAEAFATAATESSGPGCRFEPLCKALDSGHEPHHPTPGCVTVVRFSSTLSGPRRAWGQAEPVAFTRSTAIDVITDDQGNRVERRALKFDALRAAASLDHFFQYWQWLRGATACRLADLDVTQIMRAGIIGRLHVVDVRSSDPGDFRFELAGDVVPFKPPPGPSTLPVAIYADATVRDYNTVRLTGAPRLQRICGRLEGVCYHYTRLILPFLDKNRRVSHLVVAINREPGDGMRLAPLLSN